MKSSFIVSIVLLGCLNLIPTSNLGGSDTEGEAPVHKFHPPDSDDHGGG